MSWTVLILRSALIGLTLVQAVVLPRGGCCCAAERLMAVVSGNTSELPACCRVSEAKAKRGAERRQTALAADSEPGHCPCQCVTSACNSPQARPPATAESSSHERLHCWEAAQPVLIVAVAPIPCPASLRLPYRELPSLRSGQDACIALHSWRC